MKNILKELRRKERLNQKELADALHVSRQTVSAIENEHYSPTLGLAFKISLFFKMPIEKIFVYEA